MLASEYAQNVEMILCFWRVHFLVIGLVWAHNITERSTNCPWKSDYLELRSLCICAYNLKKELSVQCEKVNGFFFRREVKFTKTTAEIELYQCFVHACQLMIVIQFCCNSFALEVVIVLLVNGNQFLVFLSFLIQEILQILKQ